MNWKTRFIPVKRTAIDGRTWWVVYDNFERKYATQVCFGKYKLKSECEQAIAYYTKEWNL